MLLLSLIACGGAEPAPAPSPAQQAAPVRHEGGHGEGGHGAALHAKGHHGDDATVTHRFDDPAKWSQTFDDPARDAWQQPAKVLAALAIAPGMTVADIGAGTGYFNPHLAAAVGADGVVIASDVEPNLIAHMTERAKADGTPQVMPRLGEPSDPKLAPAEVDRVLLVDTYHHIDGRVDYFGRLKGALKPGGKLLIVDFKAGDIPVGPPPDHRIPKDKVLAELGQAGWVLESDADVLPHQFVLVFGPGGEE
jgi:predicted methyltransferase